MWFRLLPDAELPATFWWIGSVVWATLHAALPAPPSVA